jgi:hypothetical protein
VVAFLPMSCVESGHVVTHLPVPQADEAPIPFGEQAKGVIVRRFGLA